MKTEHMELTIAELTKGLKVVDENGRVELFENAKNPEEQGIYAWDGLLEVRPTYQRNFVWDEKKQVKFIESIIKGWSINPLVFALIKDELGNETYQCVDGQQRTITLCRFVNNKFRVYNRLYGDLTYKERDDLLNYKLQITINDYANEDETIEHFGVINEPITILTKQELRNAAYCGTFVESLRNKFGKKNCDITKVDTFETFIRMKHDEVEREEAVEQMLIWTITLEDDDVYDRFKNQLNHDIVGVDMTEFIDYKIKEYMKKHRYDLTCNDVYNNCLKIIKWAKKIFVSADKYSKEMSNVKNWAYLYRTYHDATDRFTDDTIDSITRDFSDFMNSQEIHHKYNVPEVLIRKYIEHMNQTELENCCNKMLSMRTFDENQKTDIYYKQDEMCPDCKRYFRFKDMQAHHIIPFCAGGRTETNNGVMLCRSCHNIRHGYGAIELERTELEYNKIRVGNL